MTNAFIIALRNGLIMGLFMLISQLIALGRFPNGYEIYSTILTMLLVVIVEIMNCFKLQPPTIGKKTCTIPVFFGLV